MAVQTHTNPAPLTDTAARSRLPAMFVALSEPNFRSYVTGMLFSFIPMAMQQVAQGYLAYTLTGSATALGIVQLVWGIPQMLLVLFAGVIADRYDRRRILILTQGSLGLLTLVMAIIIHLGRIEYWHIVAGAFLQGIAFAFNMPARQGLLSQTISRQNMANGVALNNSSTNMTRVFGPGLAGALIAIPFVGVAGVYYLMAAAYLTAMSSVVRLKLPPSVASTSKGSMFKEIGAGFRYIGSSPVLSTLILLAFVPILLGVPTMTLMPVFALRYMDVGSPGLGALLMMSGIGALAGSLMVAAYSQSNRKAVTQLIAVVLFGILLVIFALFNNFILGLLLMPLIGAAQNIYMALNNTLIMLHTDREYLGRVLSVYMMTWSITPVTTMPISAAADAFGAPIVVIVLGVLVAVLTLIIGLANPRYRADAERTALMEG